jgi:hypothetical protein
MLPIVRAVYLGSVEQDVEAYGYQAPSANRAAPVASAAAFAAE